MRLMSENLTYLTGTQSILNYDYNPVRHILFTQPVKDPIGQHN